MIRFALMVGSVVQFSCAESSVLGEPEKEILRGDSVLNFSCSKKCGTYSSKLSKTFPAAEQCLKSMDVGLKGGKFKKHINFSRGLVTWVMPLWEKVDDMSPEEIERMQEFLNKAATALSENRKELPKGLDAALLLRELANVASFYSGKKPTAKERKKIEQLLEENKELLSKPLEKK